MTQKDFRLLSEELERLIRSHRKWDSMTHSQGVADQFDDVLDLVKDLRKKNREKECICQTDLPSDRKPTYTGPID